jgi:hypothetical protein
MTEPENLAVRNAAYVIPTRTKSKIAHTLSWPVGTEQISRAIASASQLNELVLHFRDGFREEEKRRCGIYRPISVSYMANPKASASSVDGIPLFNRWEIHVGPVPRTLRHKAQEFLKSSALPAIQDWLNGRSNLEMEGAEHLTFFYDDKKEQFYSVTDERLIPLRIGQ